MENELEKLLVRLNDTQSKNKSMRDAIDVMRKEQRNGIRAAKSLRKDIGSTVESAIKMNQQTHQGKRVAEETNNQILALKAKHEEEKLNFERKIKDLQDKLKEKDETEMMKTGPKDVKGGK